MTRSVVRKMMLCGDAFAYAIGAAWLAADSANRAKLEAVFDDLFAHYTKQVQG
jgi:hypothetical protein